MEHINTERVFQIDAVELTDLPYTTVRCSFDRYNPV